jgi:proline iminopeptidase
MQKTFRILIFVIMVLMIGEVVSVQANSSSIAIEEGFVNSRGAMIYYKALGKGEPLVILHGGPGLSHDYFLPYLLPLAHTNRLIFIDERGSGRSQKLANHADYTVENMVEDLEAVRQALALGKLNLLGHSYGGVVAAAYALKYQQHLSHLVLCSTFLSTKRMNETFAQIKQKLSPELRGRIDSLEKAGLYGHGKDYEKNRYTPEYMEASWGDALFPYYFQNNPDPNYAPGQLGFMSWDVYRQMWGTQGEFVISGNLTSVEYMDRIAAIKTPTLIIVGDNDLCAPPLSQEIQERIPGSKLLILPKSGHLTFIDQNPTFITTIEKFLAAAK